MTKKDLIAKLQGMPDIPIKYYKGRIDRKDIVKPISDIRIVSDDDYHQDADEQPTPLYILVY